MSSLYVDTIRNRDGNGAPVFDKGIVISGVITASGSLGGDAVSIGATEVISGAFELKNIAGLDTTTTATIESAIANAPNDFISLNVSGISTFGDDIDLNGDIDIFGHTAANTLNAAGILTALLLSTGAEGSAIRISSNTISGPATLTIDPAGIGTNTGTVVIQGDLQVEGDTTTINSTTLTVDDKNIVLASGSLTDASSDGGGITLESGEGNKTFNWVDSTDSWTSSEHIDLASTKTFKINGNEVLSSTAVGSGVTNSSLQNVGTLAGVQVSGAATFSDSATISADLDVDGHTNLDNVNIAGVTTFASNIDADGDLDVDGHTNLDNVNIAGVSTFSSDVSVSGVTTISNTLNVTGGVSVGTGATLDGSTNTIIAYTNGSERFRINSSGRVGIGTTIPGYNLEVDQEIAITNDSESDLYFDVDYGNGTTSSATIISYPTRFAIKQGGNSRADNYIFYYYQDASTAADDYIYLECGDGERLRVTGSGNVGINSSSPQVALDVVGDTNITGVITATRFIGNLEGTVNTAAQTNITSLGTLTGLTVSGNITAQADLDVDGHTNLDNVSIAGVATVGLTTVLETGILTHDLHVSGVSTFVENATFQGNVDLGDDDRLRLGDSQDLQIYWDSGASASQIQSDKIVLRADLGLSDPFIMCTQSASVKIYYAGTPRFETSGLGVTVTGVTSTTTLHVKSDSTFTGDIDVDGHTNLDNVSIAGVTTFTGDITANSLVTVSSDLDVTQQLDVQGTSELTHVNVDGFTTVTGGTSLANVSISGVTTFTDLLDVNNASIDVAGNLNATTLRAGISTFTGFVYDELDSDTDLRNGGDFNSITGVAWTSGATDTLYWDFATAPSVIGGEADNGIGTIELANLPTSFQYATRATLITYTDSDNDWNEGNVVVKVNGQTPTNYLWRNGAQPVGTTTGASNHFDIVEFKIVHDTNNEFSVFAEWQAYHATT